MLKSRDRATSATQVRARQGIIRGALNDITLGDGERLRMQAAIFFGFHFVPIARFGRRVQQDCIHLDTPVIDHGLVVDNFTAGGEASVRTRITFVQAAILRLILGFFEILFMWTRLDFSDDGPRPFGQSLLFWGGAAAGQNRNRQSPHPSHNHRGKRAT